MESSENKSANISSPNCNKMPSFWQAGFYSLVFFFFFLFYFIIFFSNIISNPIISQIWFYEVILFGLSSYFIR